MHVKQIDNFNQSLHTEHFLQTLWLRALYFAGLLNVMVFNPSSHLTSICSKPSESAGVSVERSSPEDSLAIEIQWYQAKWSLAYKSA